MGWEVGGRVKKKGTYVYLWLIHVDIWQKPTQYFNHLSIKNNFFSKKHVIERIIFAQRLEEGEGVNHKAGRNLGALDPGRGKSQCKGPEVG